MYFNRPLLNRVTHNPSQCLGREVKLNRLPHLRHLLATRRQLLHSLDFLRAHYSSGKSSTGILNTSAGIDAWRLWWRWWRGLFFGHTIPAWMSCGCDGFPCRFCIGKPHILNRLWRCQADVFHAESAIAVASWLVSTCIILSLRIRNLYLVHAIGCLRLLLLLLSLLFLHHLFQLVS